MGEAGSISVSSFVGLILIAVLGLHLSSNIYTNPHVANLETYALFASISFAYLITSIGNKFLSDLSGWELASKLIFLTVFIIIVILFALKAFRILWKEW